MLPTGDLDHDRPSIRIDLVDDGLVAWGIHGKILRDMLQF